jgi:hypothetical protein
MKRNKFQSGQSLVEVAILFPVVIFLLTGFFDLGRAIFYYSSLTNMVREGARYGIVDTRSDDGPYLENVKRINDFAFAVPKVGEVPTDTSCHPGPCVFSGPDITVTITRLMDSGEDYFENVNVKASYSFKAVTPGINQLLGVEGAIVLDTESTMRLAASAR